MKKLLAAALAACLFLPALASARLISVPATFTYFDVNHPSLSFAQGDSQTVQMGIKNSKSATDTTVALDAGDAVFNSYNPTAFLADSTLGIRLIIQSVSDPSVTNASCDSITNVVIQGSYDKITWTTISLTLSAAQRAQFTLVGTPPISVSTQYNTVAKAVIPGRIQAVPTASALHGCRYFRAIIAWDPNALGMTGSATWQYLIDDRGANIDNNGLPQRSP